MSQTLTQAFLDTVARHGGRDALRHKQDGVWKALTWAEFGQRARALACGLVELGVAFGDRVALLSENRPEWVIADQAILMTGGATVPIYPTLTPKQTEYIINDCGAKVVIVSNPAQLKKLMDVRAGLPALTHVIVMNDFDQPADFNQVFQWSHVLELGARCADKHSTELEQRIGGIIPDTLATIVYTSGTTGEPKGAMLSHNNIQSNVRAVTPNLGITAEDSCLSFLPLSHVFERVATFAVTFVGGTISYAESIDTVPQNLVEVKPTFMASVPRLFEKIKARVLDKVASDPPIRQHLFHWAMGVGQEFREARESGKGVNFALALKHSVADSLVFSKVRERTGGNLRMCISGGAPLPADVGRFFETIGIIVVEGYGLTETSPVITMNKPSDVKFGTVGRPIADVEIKLGEDGELLARGPNIMKGYFNLPEATAQAIDPDGWFHTGDIAEVDPDGRVRIVDRKKEILVMSNGKNVAPQPIETAIKGTNLVEQSMLVGDARNFISALVVPNFEALKPFLSEQRLDNLSVEEQLRHPQVLALYKREIDKLCEGFARYEQVKKFTLLPRQFDPALNELTPTLKLKRRIICQNFSKEIEAIYASEAITA